GSFFACSLKHRPQPHRQSVLSFTSDGSWIMRNWIMHHLLSIPAGLLTIGLANLALVAGCWWWSRGKGVGLWLRRATAILLALVGVAGGTVAYRVAYLRQEAAGKRDAEVRKDMASLKTDLTND